MESNSPPPSSSFSRNAEMSPANHWHLGGRPRAPRGVSERSIGATEADAVELGAFGRVPIEIGEPDPGRSRPDVPGPWPAIPLPPIWDRFAVKPFQALKLNSSGLLGDALVLHGALVATACATDDQCDPWISPKIVELPAVVGGVEEDLEIVRDDDPDDRRLRAPGGRYGCLHGDRMLAHEAK